MAGYRVLILALGAGSATTALGAQQVRGTVVDSASRLPIPSAVVTTLDSAGRVGRRSVTDERGAYVITAPAEVRRLRIVRLGFRPAEITLPDGRADDTTVPVVMTRIPYQLQPVRVTAAANCPRRSDRALAMALLEQARAGLLATIVARSERPAQMKRLLIERSMVGTSDNIVRHHVQIESVRSTVAAFRSARSATNFVEQGFASDASDSATFFAPDAEVLLDDGFAAGYCFHIMDRSRSHPNQVGLGFKSADSRRGRIDVDGALWIDTVARALVNIEFRYVGLDRQLERYEPGGRVEFREMANGVVLIDRWFIRLAGLQADMGRRPLDPVGRSREVGDGRTTRYVVAEVGGELARARWQDGSTWVASLGTLGLKLTNMSGVPLAGVTAYLDDTDYRATTDSTGHLEITDLAPGPYSARITDARLEALGVTLQIPVSFVATRGSTRLLTIRRETAEEYVLDRCQKAGQNVGGDALIIGRVATLAGEPIKGVRWTLKLLQLDREDVAIPFGQTGSDGLFQYCNARRGSQASLTFRGGAEVLTVTRTLNDSLTVIPVKMSPR